MKSDKVDTKIKCYVRGHSVNIEALQYEYEFTAKLASFIDVPVKVRGECHNCGKRIEFSLKAPSKRSMIGLVAETVCEYKDGFPEIVTYLDVPSGEIVLFNDLRKFYEKPTKYMDICSNIGTKAYSEYYAEQGLILHFVGNTSPDVYQRGNVLSIGRVSRGKNIGSICTDLWWYCAADRIALEKVMGKTIKQYQKDYHAAGAWPQLVVAKVKPGRYKTIGRYHLDEKLFSVIKREGDIK